MTQAITMLSNADNYNGAGGAGYQVPVPSFTPAANSILLFTMTYYNTAASPAIALDTLLTTNGWVKILDTGVNHRSHVYKLLVGGSPTLIDYMYSVSDANPDGFGNAYALLQVTGSVTDVVVSNTVLSYNGSSSDTYGVPTMPTPTAGNSTYAFVSGAGGPSVKGAFSDADLTYVPHMHDTNGIPDTSGGNDLKYNLVGSGSSNQHWFAADKIIPNTATYTESLDQADTSVTFFEITGNAAPAVLPVLSGATTSGVSVTGATVEASTDTGSGDTWIVVGSAADIDNITATQIKTGNTDQDVAATLSGTQAMTNGNISIAMTGTLALSTLYSYAMVQTANGEDSVILKGTFATAGATNYGFRLPLVDLAGVNSPNETGLTAQLFSDRSAATQLGADFTSATIDAGSCEISNAELSATPTLGNSYFMRLYRTSPASSADNRDKMFEVISIDLDLAGNSLDG